MITSASSWVVVKSFLSMIKLSFTYIGVSAEPVNTSRNHDFLEKLIRSNLWQMIFISCDLLWLFDRSTVFGGSGDEPVSWCVRDAAFQRPVRVGGLMLKL